MFGKKQKSNNGIADDLYEFLEEADKLYIRAFETRSVGLLKEYFTLECCRMISRWIVAEASSRYFSDEKFRSTTWSIVDDSAELIKLEKTCLYKDIHITVTRTMKVSDDYKELWVIRITPEEFWVESVTPA